MGEKEKLRDDHLLTKWSETIYFCRAWAGMSSIFGVGYVDEFAALLAPLVADFAIMAHAFIGVVAGFYGELIVMLGTTVAALTIVPGSMVGALTIVLGGMVGALTIVLGSMVGALTIVVEEPIVAVGGLPADSSGMSPIFGVG